MIGKPFWELLPDIEDPRGTLLLVGGIFATLLGFQFLWNIGVPGWLLTVIPALGLTNFAAKPSLWRATWLLLLSCVFAFAALAHVVTAQDAAVVLAMDASLYTKTAMAMISAYSFAVASLASLCWWSVRAFLAGAG